MSHPNYGTPAPNYGDPAYAYSYATDTTGGAGIYGGGGYGGGGYSYGGGGSLGGYGLGSGLAAGYPKGGANKRTPALMGFGGMQFIPDGGVILSQSIDDVMTRLGSGVYASMLADDAVKAAVDMLVYSTMGDDIHVEPAIVAEPGERVDDSTDPQRKKDIEDAKRYADEVKRSIERVPNFLDSIEAIFTQGVVWGSGLGDPAWEVVKGPGDEKPVMLLKSLSVRPLGAWAMVVDKYGDFTDVIGYSWEGPRRYERDRFLVYVNSPRGGDPRGTSDLRAAYDPWNFKVQMRPARSLWAQQFATPTVKIIYDGNVPAAYPLNADGTEDTSNGPMTPQSQAERIAANVHNGSWMALPLGWEGELIESKNDGGAFDNYEESCNKAIFQAILLSSRTLSEAAHGSKADSESSANTTQIKIVRREKSLAKAIERGIAYTQVLANHGPDAANRLCPRIKFPEAKSMNQPALITAWAGAGWSITPRQTAAIDADLNLSPRTADEIDEIEASKKAAEQAQTDALKAKAMGPMGKPAEPAEPAEPEANQTGSSGPAAKKDTGKTNVPKPPKSPKSPKMKPGEAS